MELYYTYIARALYRTVKNCRTKTCHVTRRGLYHAVKRYFKCSGSELYEAIKNFLCALSEVGLLDPSEGKRSDRTIYRVSDYLIKLVKDLDEDTFTNYVLELIKRRTSPLDRFVARLFILLKLRGVATVEDLVKGFHRHYKNRERIVMRYVRKLERRGLVNIVEEGDVSKTRILPTNILRREIETSDLLNFIDRLSAALS